MRKPTDREILALKKRIEQLEKLVDTQNKMLDDVISSTDKIIAVLRGDKSE